MYFRRSSMGLHSCQGILLSLQKALLCNPCLRNELSPFSQEGHARLRFCTIATAMVGGRTSFNQVHSRRRPSMHDANDARLFSQVCAAFPLIKKVVLRFPTPVSLRSTCFRQVL